MSTLSREVRERSLREWYLADDRGPDAGPPPRPSRPHLAWHSPFALPLPGAGSVAQRARRIRKAGDIWLRNHDLRFSGQLWLWDEGAGTTWAFRRCREPGGQHLRLGPLPLVVLERGRRLFDHPVFYRETDDPELEALLLSLAPPREARAALASRRRHHRASVRVTSRVPETEAAPAPAPRRGPRARSGRPPPG